MDGEHVVEPSESLPDLRTRDAVLGYLRGIAKLLKVEEDNDAVAKELDKRDSLSHLRNCFLLPRVGKLLNEAEKHPSK